MTVQALTMGDMLFQRLRPHTPGLTKAATIRVVKITAGIIRVVRIKEATVNLANGTNGDSGQIVENHAELDGKIEKENATVILVARTATDKRNRQGS